MYRARDFEKSRARRVAPSRNLLHGECRLADIEEFAARD